MNVTEINPPATGSLNRYIEVTIAFTVVTSWLVVALQTESTFHPTNCSIWRRALWPVCYPLELISTAIKKLYEPAKIDL